MFHCFSSVQHPSLKKKKVQHINVQFISNIKKENVNKKNSVICVFKHNLKYSANSDLNNSCLGPIFKIKFPIEDKTLYLFWSFRNIRRK